MHRTVEAAVAGGLNLLSLGANQSYWRARVERAAGSTFPSVTVYRYASEDPVKDSALATVRWRDTGEPESRLLGSMYSCLNYYGDGHVTAPGAWPFARIPSSAREPDGTVSLPGVIGQEEDRYFDGAGPLDGDVQILAHTSFPCRSHGNAPDGWDMTYSTPPRGTRACSPSARCTGSATSTTRAWPAAATRSPRRACAPSPGPSSRCSPPVLPG